MDRLRAATAVLFGMSAPLAYRTRPRRISTAAIGVRREQPVAPDVSLAPWKLPPSGVAGLGRDGNAAQLRSAISVRAAPVKALRCADSTHCGTDPDCVFERLAVFDSRLIRLTRIYAHG